MGVDRILFEMEKRALREEERRKGNAAKRTSSNFEDIFALFASLLFILAIVGIFYFIISRTNLFVNISNMFSKIYGNVVSIITPVPAAIAFGTIALPLGYIFFKIREKKRILYGYLEIGFGVFSAVFTVGDKNPGTSLGNANLVTYVVLFTSIYIIVRGFDNLQQGRKQTRECNRLLDSSEQNQIETVKYLIESGIDVNFKSSEGVTPLMLAVENGNIEIAQFLLNKEADRAIKANNGDTALKIAEKNKNVDLINLLNHPKPSK